MKLTLDSLLLLDAIDRHGSFAAAAEALHRVPSALTHAVHRLEEALGLDLFEKSGRRAVLTPAGRTLLEEGRLLLRAADDLERRIQRVATGWESELRIAVDALIPPERVLPLIARFHAAGHETALHLGTEVLGGAWDALTTHRADLVIGAPGEAPGRAGIATQALGQACLVFTVAPSHPLASEPEPIPPSVLLAQRAIVMADTSRELAKRTVGLLEGQPALRVPDMETKAAAQAVGLGVGHLPPWLAEREVAAGRLLIRRLAEPRAPVPLFTAWRARQGGKALQWFVQELAQEEVKVALVAGLA